MTGGGVAHLPPLSNWRLFKGGPLSYTEGMGDEEAE